MSLMPLNQREAEVYFASTWYQNQIRARRARLIAEGWIVWPEPHRNESKAVGRVIVSARVH